MNIKLNQDKNILMVSAKNKNHLEKNLKLKKLEYPWCQTNHFKIMDLMIKSINLKPKA